MAGNHVLLETIELTSSASSVTFDNLPSSGYTDLKLVISARQGAENAFDLTFNGSTSSYSVMRLQGDGSGASSNTASGHTAAIRVIGITPSGNTANTFSNSEIYIPNYTSSNYKSVSYDGVNENNATEAYMNLAAGLWSNTAAITSITITPRAGSLEAYSTFSLYGVAATGTTPVTAPLATGGNIVANDGTYWYHAFLTSGTFTPQTALTCDALLVAGGGAGGWDLSGGGGAGGVVASNSAFAVSTAQAVTIGAGGTGGTYSSVAYTSGSDTVFNSWTALGGGKGNSTGGSGGGAGIGASGATISGKAATQTSPTGATGYGNAGGDAYQNGSIFASGGGGGAGGVGGSRSSNNGGAGGAGKNTWSSWLSATSTGVSGYIAGGGGGGVYSQGTSGAGGSGGGGAGWTGAASANPASPVTETMHGVRGTGGGGGGAGANFAGGNGGSGIVIIRYAMV